MVDSKVFDRANRGVSAVRAGFSVLALGCVAAVLAGPAGAAPVTGSISGPVVSVKGSTFKVTTALSPTGTAMVSVGKKTTITTQKTLPESSLKTGMCVQATGSKNAKGVVVASRISLAAPVKGVCTTGFTRRGPRPAGSGTRPPGAGAGSRPGGGFGNFANFGFAFGKIAALKGGTLTVKGSLSAKSVTTTVTVSAKTRIAETVKVDDGAIAPKMCVFVRGTSTTKGVTVAAQNIALTKPSATGCRFGFAGR